MFGSIINYCVMSLKLPQICALTHNRAVSYHILSLIFSLPHNLLLDVLRVDIWVMATVKFMLKAFLLSSLTPLCFCSLPPFTIDVAGEEIHPPFLLFMD